MHVDNTKWCVENNSMKSADELLVFLPFHQEILRSSSHGDLHIEEFCSRQVLWPRRLRSLLDAHIPYWSAWDQVTCLLLIQLPVIVLEKHQVMVQALVSLLPLWELSMEFLVSGFSINQPGLLQTLENKSVEGRSLSLSHFCSHSLSLCNSTF